MRPSHVKMPSELSLVSVPAVCEFWLKSVSWQDCHFALRWWSGEHSRFILLTTSFDKVCACMYMCVLTSGTHLKSRFDVRVVTPPSFWPFHRTITLFFSRAFMNGVNLKHRNMPPTDSRVIHRWLAFAQENTLCRVCRHIASHVFIHKYSALNFTEKSCIIDWKLIPRFWTLVMKNEVM